MSVEDFMLWSAVGLIMSVLFVIVISRARPSVEKRALSAASEVIRRRNGNH